MTAPSAKRLEKIQIRMAVLCAAAVILTVIFSYRAGLLRWTDNYLYDLHFKWRGPAETSGNVVLVLMDQKSADELGRTKSSWARGHMAQALENLCASEAEIIGLDMIFAAPDTDPQTDLSLAGVMEQCNNIVLARGSSTYGGELASLELFQATMIGDGFIDLFLDEDEVLRRVRYLNANPLPNGELELLPSFSLELARNYLNIEFDFDLSSPEYLRMGGKKDGILLPQPELIINYIGDYTGFPSLSYADVVKNRFSAGAVKGKLIIIGSSLAIERDVFSTPYTRFQRPDDDLSHKFGSMVKDILAAKDLGMACHAHAVETILNRAFIRKTSFSWIAVLTVMLGILGLIFYTSKIGVVWEALLLCAGLIVIVFAGHMAFLQKQWVDISPFLTVLIVQYVIGVVLQKVFDKKKTSLVTDLFGKYVSYSVVNELISGNLDLSLEGRSQELSILFSDIRDFTTLSEQLEAKDTGRLLNYYFSNMIPLVFNHKGTLDKLMGDAIMAFFGAPLPLPDHPIKAAETALSMLDTLKNLKNARAVRGIAHLNLGIGINTGVATVGNLGSNEFMDYTIVGDSVNLASRLEGMNKTYGTQIIVSEFTAAKLDDRFLLRELDRVKAKGKMSAVTIYELISLKEAADREDLSFVTFFESGLAAYKRKCWDESADMFQQALNLKPHDQPARLYLDRISRLRQLTLPDDWEGVTSFEHK